MKIGVLTSTRADFGIYIPLLDKLCNDTRFSVEIIAFGTHISDLHGFTLNEIKAAGFNVAHKLDTMPLSDSPGDISKAMGKTFQVFGPFWESNFFDLVFCLGDRYEMFAAVASALPFNVKFAHFHAGETTLGAIDNAYRHSISLMSEYLFVSTEEYKSRAIEISKTPEHVYNVGALSIDNLSKIRYLTTQEIESKFGVDLSKPTILSTFHPETVDYKKNYILIDQLLMAYKELSKSYQLLITMPNADTMGMMIRKRLIELASTNANIILRESLGMIGYLSAMKHCKFLLGNTSSGFVEAAFFPKWVINLGDRQKGRILTSNIITVPLEANQILSAVKSIENKYLSESCNIYGQGNSAQLIVDKIIQQYGL